MTDYTHTELRHTAVSPTDVDDGRDELLEIAPWLHVEVGGGDGHLGSGIRVWLGGERVVAPPSYASHSPTERFVCARPMVGHPEYEQCVLVHSMTNVGHTVMWDELGHDACYRTGDDLRAHPHLFALTDEGVELVNLSDEAEWCTERWNRFYASDYWSARNASMQQPAVMASQPLPYLSDRRIAEELYRRSNITEVPQNQDIDDLSWGERMTQTEIIPCETGGYTAMCESCGRRAFYPERVVWTVLRNWPLYQSTVDDGEYYQCEHCRDAEAIPAYMLSGFRDEYGYWPGEDEEALEDALTNTDSPAMSDDGLTPVEQHTVARTGTRDHSL